MATVVQVTSADGNPASSQAAPSINVTAGNKLVVIGKLSNNFTPTGTVTDSQGNTYTLDWDATDANAGTNALGDHVVFSCTVASTAACVVTFNPAVSGRIAVVVYEVSGLGTHNGSTRVITRFVTSGTPSSGSLTPSAATGLIFGFVSVGGTVTWEAEYNNNVTQAATDGRFSTGVDISVTAAAQAADCTVSSGLWDCGAIWYPDAGAAATPARRSTRMTMGVGR